MPDHYRFLIENPVNSERTCYAAGYPNVGGVGDTEEEARRDAMSRADLDADEVQVSRGERLGRVVRVNGRWVI
ncbi:MAG: hypothetical protein ACRD0P_32175 [Stackebrandtia sp.]